MLDLKTLKKIPYFILIIDPHKKSKPINIKGVSIKKLSSESNNEFNFLDKNCKKICDCPEPDLIILIDHVLHFNIGCFKLIRQGEIFFVTDWYDKIVEDALKYYSECEIRNGL